MKDPIIAGGVAGVNETAGARHTKGGLWRHSHLADGLLGGATPSSRTSDPVLSLPAKKHHLHGVPCHDISSLSPRTLLVPCRLRWLGEINELVKDIYLPEEGTVIDSIHLVNEVPSKLSEQLLVRVGDRER